MKILNLKNIPVIKTITTVLAVMMIAPGAKAVPPTGQPSAQGMGYFTRICGQSLIGAARSRSAEDVEFAVRNGSTDSAQRAVALRIAVENNYYEIVKFLLPWCKNNPDAIALALCTAVENNCCDSIIRLLLQYCRENPRAAASARAVARDKGTDIYNRVISLLFPGGGLNPQLFFL